MLSAASSVVTLMAQSALGAVRSLEGIPFGIRVANALVSYVRYLFGMLWPHDLSIFYPHPGNALQPWLVVVCTLLLMGLSAALFYLAPRRPYLGVGWLWYLFTLLPVIGLVQVGDQAMADRYTYIPLVGVFIAGVWGAADLFAGCRVRRIFAVAFACAVFLALMVATRSQLRHWRNTETLFRQALRVHENNYLAHFLLAQVEEMAGEDRAGCFPQEQGG